MDKAGKARDDSPRLALPEAVSPVIRAGQDADAPGFIALIAACWAEYPGCVMDLDGEVPELRALASYFAGQGGALWVAEAGGDIAGNARARLEKRLGRPIISKKNFLPKGKTKKIG